MKELASEDKYTIEDFIGGIRACTHFDMPVEKAPELYSPVDVLRILPGLRRWPGRWSRGQSGSISFRKRRLSKGIDAHDYRVYDVIEEFPPVMGRSFDGGDQTIGERAVYHI